MSLNKIILFDTGTDVDVTVEDLDEQHRAMGYKRHPDGYCKYHYLIDKSGSVHAGLNENLCGYHNSKSEQNGLLVCLVGYADIFTAAQIESCRAVLKTAMLDHPIRNANAFLTDEIYEPTLVRKITKGIL